MMTTSHLPATQSSDAQRTDRLAPWGLLALLLFVISAIVAGWRYFPGLTGDHAWYLQVALRVSRGETLYRDVAWAYGPLPTFALAALFRWLGPDAAWASAINGLLAVLGILLTYAVVRSVLSAGGALVVTAFAALAGPSVWGGLFHIYYYTYTQAIAWGAVASLAALAAALYWQRKPHHFWLILAGLATALAALSKPEFGVAALGGAAVAIFASRGSPGAWAVYLASTGAATGIGLGLPAWSAGWWRVWRGYTGYSQLITDSPWLWGTRLANKRLLTGGFAFWIAVAAIWAGQRRPHRRLVFYALACLAALAVLLVGVTYLLGATGAELLAILRQAAWSQLAFNPTDVLFLVALPWAPILPLLLLAGWLARRRTLPAAWWPLWAYAVISSLRPVLTGQASGFAMAPALAVFWVWIAHAPNTTAPQRERRRRLALALLAALATANLVAQVVVPAPLYNQPRVKMDSSLGTLRLAQTYQAEAESVTAFVEQNVPADAPIFTVGYGTHWYLLTKRPNPTPFDLFGIGLGMDGPETAGVEQALLAQPPAAVIVPSSWRMQPDNANRTALHARQNLPAWWQDLEQHYADQTPAAVRSWRILVRQPAE